MFSRLYLHLPWCLSKCHYCAFNSRPLEPEKLDPTCTLMIREMQLAATLYPGNRVLESVYLGGGTPSLLSPEQVDNLITCSRRLFGHASSIEITLEANPGTVTTDRLTGYRQAGVTRLSLGAQSFCDHSLRLLGRRHTAADIRSAFGSATEAGFSSIGLDLICGLPGQTGTAWEQDLLEAVALAPTHLSIYGLTIEEGTPFARQYPAGSVHLPDDELSATMLEQADAVLTASGYEHYEIANFARPGHRSEHNCGYWKRDGYLGIGPGAHSFLRRGWGVRWGNLNDYDAWAAAIRNNLSAATDQEILTREDALSEYLFLGLRMADGISLDQCGEEFGLRPERRFSEEIRQLQRAGLLTCSPERLALTKQGMLLSNQVFVRFI